MPSIIVSGQEVATNADILNGTRLATAPAAGVMMFELQASDNDATNNYTASIQLPGGETPMNATRVCCGNTAGLAGVIDARTSLVASFGVQQGGQVLFSCTETGDSELTWRVTFRY